MLIRVNFDLMQEIGPKVGAGTLSKVDALSQDFTVHLQSSSYQLYITQVRLTFEIDTDSRLPIKHHIPAMTAY